VNHRLPRINWEAHDLDKNSPDDQLIANILQHQDEHPDETIVLYTHDIGPRLTAARLSITAKPIPDEDKLAPEQDETEKENERLKRELHELKTAAPQLTLRINDALDNVSITTLTPQPDPIDENSINAQADTARDKLPTYDLTEIQVAQEDTAFSRGTNGELVLDLDRIAGIDHNLTPPSEYTRYEREREAYRNAYAEFLRNRYTTQLTHARTLQLEIALHNDGGARADDMDISVEVPQHVTIDLVPAGVPRAPSPPQQPRSHAEMFTESVRKMADFPRTDFHNHFISNINPFFSGPKIEGADLTWRLRSLKHGFHYDLGTIYVILPEKIMPFTLTYSIHASNAVTPFVKEVLIKPIIATKK
jgi:hypothetical protein